MFLRRCTGFSDSFAPPVQSLLFGRRRFVVFDFYLVSIRGSSWSRGRLLRFFRAARPIFTSGARGLLISRDPGLFPFPTASDLFLFWRISIVIFAHTSLRPVFSSLLAPSASYRYRLSLFFAPPAITLLFGRRRSRDFSPSPSLRRLSVCWWRWHSPTDRPMVWIRYMMGP
jgi:hypothetical protein